MPLLSAKVAAAAMGGLTFFQFVFSITSLASTIWANYSDTKNNDKYNFGLWRGCVTDPTGTEDCFDVPEDAMSSNLGGARFFTVIMFITSLVTFGGAIQTWRTAAATPYPKVVFFGSVAGALFALIVVCSFAVWASHDVLSAYPTYQLESKAGGFVTAVLNLFLFLGSAAVVFFGFGPKGAWGPGVPPEGMPSNMDAAFTGVAQPAGDAAYYNAEEGH